jgi:beta-lactamase regulating signal transducer with metallopeptidase domain
MEVLQTFSQVASATLISGIWQGAILAAVIWLCLKLAPRTGAGVRFNIWTAVFAATSMLPLLSKVIGGYSLTRAAASVTSGGSVILLDSRWALGILGVWTILAASRLLVLTRNAFKVRAIWRSSVPIGLTPALQSILSEPRLRGAQLCSSSRVDQPCVIGFFSPRILIPEWLLKTATPSELEQIVLHESAHLRRFDDWTNLIQKLAVACFPLNPALIWIERRLCAEREVACDESVVRATNAPRDYATCLTNLAEQRLSRRKVALSGALSLGAWERRSQLAGRVESILLGKAKLGPMQARALALSLMIATAGGAIKLGSTAQLVSFAAAQPNAPFAQSNNEPEAGPHYQNVVFHPATASATANSSLLGNAPTPTELVKHAIPRPAMKSSTHRTRHSRNGVEGVESLVIVTRWQSVYGQQMTVVNQFVRISALSAAQLHGGWFVVQL